MKLTLKDGGIAPEQIDHINAHGTGTHMNDSCETAAIHAVFGDHAKDIAVVSTKSMTGHLLGGAGGIEAVFTALALRDQFAPPHHPLRAARPGVRSGLCAECGP